MFLFNKRFFYLHVVREQSRHGSQELVAVEHGARQLPLLHQHGGDPVSVRDARKMLTIDPVYFMSQRSAFSFHGTRNISLGKIKQTT